jgi:hypothetical protein
MATTFAKPLPTSPLRSVSDPEAWNPRVLEFCRLRGFDPASVNPRDFNEWAAALWHDWNRETKHEGPHSYADHQAFDLWLVRHVDAVLSGAGR